MGNEYSERGDGPDWHHAKHPGAFGGADILTEDFTFTLAWMHAGKHEVAEIAMRYLLARYPELHDGGYPEIMTVLLAVLGAQAIADSREHHRRQSDAASQSVAL
jgi:hypothetical protein